MNRLFFSFIIISLFISCNNLLQERASWDFMQKADFEIGLPVKNSNIYYLPFSCDLTKYNSAPLAINKSNIKINNENEIEFYLFFTLSKDKNMENIKLGKINIGNYKVYYIDEDDSRYLIGEIDIEK